MTSPRVLISGAGIAGSTLAYWLARHGFRPTVVERSQGQRSSGNPIDVRGPALTVAEQMGIVGRLREAATLATVMRVVDDAGGEIARVRVPTNRSPAGTAEIELPRGDLAAILYEAARDQAEFRFDDTIVDLRPDGDGNGVEVTFDRAPAERFDYVVGTDGLHSNVRRLAFGPESQFVTHAGLYVATMPLGAPIGDEHEILMYNTPGRLVSIHPSRGEALVAFIFRGSLVDGYDYRDAEQHKRIVSDAYAGAGWRVPELLARLREVDEFYFDSVSVVRLPSWARGRIGLLGDAASCVSLFGDGSTLAMAGAFTLAAALAASPLDPAAAWRRYETEHRTLVNPKQRAIGRAAGLLVPKTRLGIATRNLAARTLLSARRVPVTWGGGP